MVAASDGSPLEAAAPRARPQAAQTLSELLQTRVPSGPAPEPSPSPARPSPPAAAEARQQAVPQPAPEPARDPHAAPEEEPAPGRAQAAGVVSAPPVLVPTSVAQLLAQVGPLGRKKRKTGPAVEALEAEVRSRRGRLAACLDGEGASFASSFAVHHTALQLAGELFHMGDTQGLCDIVGACAQYGRGALPSLDGVFQALRGTVGMSERAVTFEIYRKVVDTICLSVDTTFSQQALDMLMRYAFAPSVGSFVSPDAQEYFVRQQHFLSLELVEEVGTALQTGIEVQGSTPCDIFPARNSFAAQAAAAASATSTDVAWEVKPHRPWVIPREQFREETNQATPFKGDILVLVVGTSFVLGVVQEVLPHGEGHPSSVVVTVEQAERLNRLLRRTSRVAACVAGSKIAYDRMRAAVYELSRKTTGAPAMQQWLLLRRPTARDAADTEAEIPKDGRVRLWALPQGSTSVGVERWGLDCVGAEWCELLLPGMRSGQMVFAHENPYGAEDYEPEECLGKIVVASRGQCSFADKARNAASAGAAGLVVVDSGDSQELFCMHRDDKPFVVELPAGRPAGLRLGLRFDGRAVVVEIAPGSAAFEQVAEGDLVEDIVGARSDLRFEDLDEILGGDVPLVVPLQVVVRWDRALPAIPAALIGRADGERLMLAARQGGAASAPLLELHIAEAANASAEISELAHCPALAEGLELNGPQREAVKAALLVQSTGRGGGHVSLIQGPPGTGKTTAALHIIYAWLENDLPRELAEERLGAPLPPGPQEAAAPRKKVLVTGFSNVAIDNIALGLQRLGIGPMLRVGRGQSLLTRDTLDLKLRQHSDYPELERLKAVGTIGSGSRVEAMKLQRRMGHELVSEARVVLCTCISAGGDIVAGSRFSRVLFDEATQATEPAALVPLLKGCEELVLLGDQKQLPPTTFCHKARTLGLHESLFERLVRMGLPHTMLRVQYRMHPGLAVFPSQAFYSSLLSDGVRPEERPLPRGYKWPCKSTPLCFEGVGSGGERLEECVGTSRRNQREAARLAEIVFKLIAAGDVKAEDIAVITPYSAQLGALRSALSRRALPVAPATVDQFQGMEREVVVCSAVRSSPTGVGFLHDRRRFNVLLTRARRALIVLGHQQTLLTDPCWRDWLVHLSLMGLTCGDVEPKLSNLTVEPPEEEKGPGGSPGCWMEFAQGVWPRRPTAPRSAAPPPALRAPLAPGLVTPVAPGSAPALAAARAAAAPARGAAAPVDDARLRAELARTRRLLMENPHTGFRQLGSVPVDFQEEGPQWARRFTGLLMLVLPARGASVARGSGPTQLEAEARCSARALELLAEVGLADAGAAVEAAARLEALCGPEAPAPAPAAQAGATPAEAAEAAAEAAAAAADAAAGAGVRHPKQALLATGLFAKGLPPVQITQSGPSHQPMFTASMSLPLRVPAGGAGQASVQGVATSKKEAERKCCEKALSVLAGLCPEGFPGCRPKTSKPSKRRRT